MSSANDGEEEQNNQKDHTTVVSDQVAKNVNVIRSNRWYDVSFDRWIELLLTAAIMGATVVNVCIANKQWKVANGQLLVMRDDQRAWVKAPLVIDGDLYYAKMIGLTLPFHFELSNVGHAPAFNVRTLAFLYTPQRDKEDVLVTWRERCEDWKSDNTSGTVLLPGEIAPSNNTSIGNIPVLGDQQIDNGLILSGANPRTIPIYIIGCVDYIIDGTKTHHQTGIFYRLQTWDKRGGWDIAFDPHSTIARSDIVPVMGAFLSDMTY